MDPPSHKRIVVYDGHCHLCSNWIRFFQRHPAIPPFILLPLQSARGGALLIQNGIDPDDPTTFLVIDRGRIRTASDATIHLLTSPGMVLQPLTGLAMVFIAGYPISLHWLSWSIGLYVLVGCCWLPVVWLQLRMRDQAIAAERDRTALPDSYFRHYRWWFLLGWPAFAGVLVIFYLMASKPAL